MRRFEDAHPLTVTLHLLAIIGVAMFVRNPVIQLIALGGALSYLLLEAIWAPSVRGSAFLHGYALLLFVGFTLLNPLWNQRGDTVLFFLNGRPVTLEALCYGAVAALMLVSVLYWFVIVSRCLTADRLLCVLGKCSAGVALAFSMGLRQSTLLGTVMRHICEAQKTAGLAHEQNLIDRLRSRIRAFSAVISWAIENGIVTADSMAARGYGVGKRSQFSIFVFRAADGIQLCGVVLLTAIAAYAAFTDAVTVQFYPVYEAPAPSAAAIAAYCAYGVLCAYPAFCNLKEVIMWRCLRSGISDSPIR